MKQHKNRIKGENRAFICILVIVLLCFDLFYLQVISDRNELYYILDITKVHKYPKIEERKIINFFFKNILFPQKLNMNWLLF